MTGHPTIHRKLWLEALVKNNGFTRGVELGVHQGVTFSHLVNSCPNLTMYGVDPWPVDYAEVWHADLVEKFKDNERAILIKGSSFTAHELFEDGSLDFVFIDADHQYESVKKDIMNWYFKIKPGGYICGHDIGQNRVRKAVEEFNMRYERGIDAIWFWKVEY